MLEDERLNAAACGAAPETGAGGVGVDLAASVGEVLGVPLAKIAPLLPLWFRPAIVGSVVLAHAAALTALSFAPSAPPPAVATIEATVIAAGDEAPATTTAAEAPAPSPEPEAKPPTTEETKPAPVAETPPPIVAEDTPPPEPPPPVAQEPPQRPPPVVALPPAPEPPVVARVEEPPAEIEKPAPPPPPRVETPARPKPAPKPAAERPKPAKPAAPKVSAAAPKASAPSEAHRVGVPAGAPVDTGAARASYAALVVAEIQAHRYYPSSARERGEQGAVGVAFTIGAGGHVASASVVRPSGYADLDDAARQIVRSIAPPPPPGGSFAASTTIRFRVE